MKETWIVIFVLLFFSCSDEQPEVTFGEIIRHKNFQSEFVSERHIDVLLPEDYLGSKKYPVLYMHDGQMLFDSKNTWNNQEWGVDECLAKATAESKMKSIIVVGIHNAGKKRHVEYFPQKALNYLDESSRERLKEAKERDEGARLDIDALEGDNYLKFLVNELKPFIDKTYKTKPKPQHTAIGGSSMGGLISMYAFCEYPEVFGSAICMSTHWPGVMLDKNPLPSAFIQYLAEHLPEPKEKRKIYFDLGTETLDAQYKIHQQKVDRLMKIKSYNGDYWMTKRFQGHGHDEQAWRKRLHIPLSFVFGK